MKTRHLAVVLTLLPTLAPTLAMAHPGHALQMGFAAGALHPLSGLDHLLAMLAVGLWAAQLGGRLRVAVPLSFVSLMSMAAWLSMGGAFFDAVEQGIVASVCVLGLLLACSVRLPALACVLLIGLFAVFHGYAHGVEVPQQISVAWYLCGFTFTTLGLHVAGLMLGDWFGKQHQNGLRIAGVAMAISGVTLWAGQALA